MSIMKSAGAVARAAIAVVAAFAAGSAFADGETISSNWYSFDEHEPGWTPTTNDPIIMTNTYDAASFVEASPYALTSDIKGATPAAYMPRYATPFQGMRIYDPITNTRRTNRSSLRFNTAAKNGGTGGSYYGGAVIIPRKDKGTGTATWDAVTVECIVCTTGCVVNTFSPIFGMRNGTDWAHEAWALYMTSNGKLEVRLRTVGSGTGAHVSGTGGSGTKTINDGNWHHVAMVYDKTDGACHVYVDYTESFTYTVPTAPDDPITYVTGTEEQTSLYIGGYLVGGDKGRMFNGCIDELRITQAALVSSQFLRFTPDDSDEILHLRMDPHGYWGGEPSTKANYAANYYTKNYIYAFNNSYISAKYTDCGGTVSFDGGEKFAATIYDGQNGAATFNYGSYSAATNADGKAGFLKVASLTTRMTGGNVETNMDYTVEAFFKTRTTGTAYGPRTIYTLGTWPVAGAVVNNTADGRLCFTWNDGKAWRGTYSTETTANDGNWHHIATVCDTARKQMRFYYDGKLTAVSNNVDNVIQTGSSLFVGAKAPANAAETGNNGFDGCIDDVRVTMRALAPSEFLTANGAAPAEGDADTVALMDFEDNYATSPYPALTGVGEGTAHSAEGKVPEFTRLDRYYCIDGSNGVKKVRGHKAVKLEDSQIVWPYSPLYEQDAFTVEFFADLTGLYGGGSPIRYIGGTESTTADPVWALYKDTSYDSMLCLRIQLMKDGNTQGNYSAKWNFEPNPIADGQWHHYALTVAPKDGTNTVVELFRDYASLGAFELEGRLDYSIGKGGRLAIGAGAAQNKVKGWYDMLRFSRRVLSPEDFMCKIHSGTVIVVK